MAYESVQRATKHLKLHPYRGQVCHELKEIEKDKRSVTADGSDNLYEMV
jgi:hypothetical protein